MAKPDPATFGAMMPLAETLGIEVLEAGKELVRARMAWASERCTAGDVLHGGALMALADTAGAVCAFLNLPDGAVGTTTIESKTNLLRPVSAGFVTAESRPIHRGGTVAGSSPRRPRRRFTSLGEPHPPRADGPSPPGGRRRRSRDCRRGRRPTSPSPIPSAWA